MTQPIIKRKITTSGGKWGFYETEDFTAQFEDMLASEGKEAADHYFRPGTFLSSEMITLNGIHFLFGYLETLWQSGNCPPQLQLCDPSEIIHTVEIVVDDAPVVPAGSLQAETMDKVIQMFRDTHKKSQSYMEGMTESNIQHPKVMKLYQHYWVSNLKLENIIDLLEVTVK